MLRSFRLQVTVFLARSRISMAVSFGSYFAPSAHGAAVWPGVYGPCRASSASASATLFSAAATAARAAWARPRQ